MQDKEYNEVKLIPFITRNLIGDKKDKKATRHKINLLKNNSKNLMAATL